MAVISNINSHQSKW